MLDALVGGRLYGVPQRRPGKAETTFVTAKMRAIAGDNESSVLVNVIAFEESAATSLLALGDGDAVALSGNITPKVWTDKQGIARPAIDMVVHQVMSAYQVERSQWNGD